MCFNDNIFFPLATLTTTVPVISVGGLAKQVVSSHDIIIPPHVKMYSFLCLVGGSDGFVFMIEGMHYLTFERLITNSPSLFLGPTL